MIARLLRAKHAPITYRGPNGLHSCDSCGAVGDLKDMGYLDTAYVGSR